MTKYCQTALQCPQCFTITYIQRKQGNQKKAGHLKKLYCYVCNDFVNQVEIRNPEEFYIDDTVSMNPVNKKHDRVICKKHEE